MKFELNFLPDIPTVNERIYEMKDLEEIFNKTDIPVTSFPSKKGEVDIKNIIGFANLSELSEDKIEFDVRPVKQDMLDAVKEFKLTVSAFGNVKQVDVKGESGLIIERKKVVKELHLVCLYPIPDVPLDV